MTAGERAARRSRGNGQAHRGVRLIDIRLFAAAKTRLEDVLNSALRNCTLTAYTGGARAQAAASRVHGLPGAASAAASNATPLPAAFNPSN